MSIRPEMADWLQGFVGVLHSASWQNFQYLLVGLLYGPARSSAVRATDSTLTCTEILDGYNGRWSAEPGIQEIKDLGLGYYRGGRVAGVRRHPLLVAVPHSLLSLVALR